MMSKLEILKAARRGATDVAYEIAKDIPGIQISFLLKKARQLVEVCERVEWLQSEIDDELARLEDETDE